MTFIQSKQAYHFNGAGESFEIPAFFVGGVPEWVTQTVLFKLAVSDGSITFVGHNPKVSMAGTGTAEAKASSEKTTAK